MKYPTAAMSRTLGLQIFLAVMFLAGTDARADPIVRCLPRLNNYEEKLYSLTKTTRAELLSAFCTDQTSFYDCLNKVTKEESGYTVKELANHWINRGTAQGNFLTELVKKEEHVKEVCQNGAQRAEDFSLLYRCSNSVQGHAKSVSIEHCKMQSARAYQIFRELQLEREFREDDDKCIGTAYLLGCIGASVHKECGDEEFKRYKDSVKEGGYFRSGRCSPDLTNILNTTFLDNLNRVDTQIWKEESFCLPCIALAHPLF